MKTLQIFESIDGPPQMHISMGFEWRLLDEGGKVIAECDNGYKSLAAAREAAKAMPFDWSGIALVEIGKFNPFDPSEYVNGEYRGTL